MERTSNTFLKVGMIVSLVVGAIVLCCVPLFLVIGFSSNIREMILEDINSGRISYQGNGVTPEEFVTIMQVTFVTLGFVMLTIGAICIANAFICSAARKSQTRGLYIAAIITGAMSTDFAIPGGVLGLISLSKKSKKQNQIEE